MWSTRTDIRDTFPFTDKEACNVCGRGHDFTITVEQDYFVFYGLRLFPLKKRFVSSCAQCSRRQNIALTDTRGMPDARYLTIENKPYSLLKYYSGWLMLALLGAFIIWFYLYLTQEYKNPAHG